jgi:hypothetical protein
LPQAAAALLLAMPSIAIAQKEQWLDYQISDDGRGYLYLELSTNAPPDVALPKLSGKPYFAKWSTPMDPAGRWICLERAGKSGPYNRLYVDSSGKRRLDEQQPITVDATDDTSCSFGRVRMVLKGPDGPCTYHLALQCMNYGDGIPRLLASSVGFYSGSVDFGGKKHKIELLDTSVNGTFNDATADHVHVLGQPNENKAVGRLLEVDGEFYEIEVARDGAFIKVQKAKEVALGKVHVPESISQFIAIGEQGDFLRKPTKGELTLPVGKYRVNWWTIERKDSRGAKWTMTGYNFGEAADFVVGPEKTASLDLGEPVRMVMEAQDRTNEVSFSLSFKGPLGESVSVTRGDAQPRGPTLTLTSADGAYGYTNNFEFG